MGTETVYSLLSICLRFHIIVKLNNPLMGTETGLMSRYDKVKVNSIVKLNNPLMGTETLVLNFSLIVYALSR